MQRYDIAPTGRRDDARLPAHQYRRLQAARAIKDRYADGEPLVGRDLAFMAAMLRQHPRAADKIGVGVAGIVAHRYIGGSRCFFVVRVDGSAEDFSARKCCGGSDPPRSARVRAMMAAFPRQRVVAAFRRAARTPRTGAVGSRP